MPKHDSRVRVALLFAAVAAFTTGVQAQNVVRSGQGFVPTLFEPALDTKGHIALDGSPVLPHLAFSIGLNLNFAFHTWMAVEQRNTPAQDDWNPYDHIFLQRMLQAVFQANFGLIDRLAVGFQIPIFIPAGDYYRINYEGVQERGEWSSDGTFGDIALHAKVAVLRSDWHPVGLAFIGQYYIPSGKSEILTGEPKGGAFAARMVFDSEPALWYRVGLNAGIRLPLGAPKNNYFAWNQTNTLLFHNGPSLFFGLAQSFNLWPGVLDFVAEFYGNQVLTDVGDTAYLSLEGSGGFKLFVEENSFLLAGYAHGIPIADTPSKYGLHNAEHRMFLGFCYEPSMKLRIRDEELDRDGDGYVDSEDQCPDDPEDFNGFQDEDGCPENDMDGDGIRDAVDKCPLVPEDKDGDRDEDGCPEQKEYVGEASAGPSKTSDRDMDRIVDIDDQCPDDPETYNGTDDEDGCPDEGNVVVTNSALMILKKVYFEYNSDKIKEISYPILNEVAATIINNPQITLIEIQGHADERGNDRYNLRLTQRRAASVYRYLIERGVPKEKLQYKGYGEYCPVNPESNEAAWEQNRRVEFKVVEVNGNPTGVQLACPRAEEHGL